MEHENISKNSSPAHLSHCRGCGADLLWAVTERGKRMPLDPAPLPVYASGCDVITSERTCRPAEPLLDQGAEVLMNHWASCPKAGEFKAAKGGAR